MSELHKVVHVMRRLAPEKWGGTEAVVYNLACELTRQGIESPVHCTSICSAPGSVSLGPVRIVRHRYVFPWIGLSRNDREAMRLKGGSPLSLPLFWGLLREGGVSVIHTHVQHRLGGMARTAARLKGIPYVVTLHGGVFTLPQHQIETMTRPFAGKWEWGKLFGLVFGSRRVLDDADAIICVGQSEYDEASQRLPHKQVFLVSNGVDVQRFANADAALFREAYGFDCADRIVLCVSRIDYQKNQLGLVRAFARFVDSHPDHRLVLLGPVSVTSCYAELAAEIEHLNLAGRVRIIDGLAPDDPRLPSAYKAAEMFVLPSVHEPFGIVVLEAWAAGVPVIASRVGGIPGFAVDGETALLVEPNHEEALRKAMDAFADNASLRSAMARKAYDTVTAGYDWTAVTARMREIYEHLVSRS